MTRQILSNTRLRQLLIIPMMQVLPTIHNDLLFNVLFAFKVKIARNFSFLRLSYMLILTKTLLHNALSFLSSSLLFNECL